MAAMSSSFYDVLGIHVGASSMEIKAAYRRLARVCHPDAVSMPQKKGSATEFIKIHAAYSTLSDPDKRATYDRDLNQRGTLFGWQAEASVPKYGRSRNWETDQCW